MAKAPLNNDTLPPVAPTGHTTSPDDTMMMIRAFTSSRTNSDDVSHSNASSAQHPGTHFKLSTSNESQGNTAVSDDATAVDLDALTDGNAFMRAGASVDPNKTVIMTHLDQEPTDQIASDDLDGLDLAALESSPSNDTYDGYAEAAATAPEQGAPTDIGLDANPIDADIPDFNSPAAEYEDDIPPYEPFASISGTTKKILIAVLAFAATIVVLELFYLFGSFSINVHGDNDDGANNSSYVDVKPLKKDPNAAN